MDQSGAVVVSLRELEDGTVSLQCLENAFGQDSLGIVVVKDLPEQFAGLRRRLLSFASYLAALPPKELAKVERPETRYNVGWSCGKETLKNGQYDTFKGSYYAQPIHDELLEEKARKMFPDLTDMTSANVWPDESILPGFRECFEELCKLIVDVAALVARSCDRYGLAKLDGYKDGTLENIVKSSVSTKARLLHYFPPPTAREEVGSASLGATTEDDWCGLHHDLGALTGLTSNMFVDETQYPPKLLHDRTVPDLPELDHHPDPRAGLWIKDRAGRLVQVNIPRNCLAFQTGEALQHITRGKFRAVPHFVRGAAPDRAGKIARNTLAVFTQPNLWEIIDEARNLNFASLAQEMFAKTT